VAKGNGCRLEGFVVLLVDRSVADSTYEIRAEQSKDRIPSLSLQECVEVLEDVYIYNHGIFEVSTSKSTTTSSK